MPDRLTGSHREAMKAAMDAGVPAEMRREMGEDVRDEQPLALDGAERYGFEVCWRTLAASPVASRECARCHRPDYMHAATIPEQGIYECWVDGALVCAGWVPPEGEVS